MTSATTRAPPVPKPTSIIRELPAAPGFTVRQLLASTPIKDQQSSGTCWSFATTSFLESEALRLGRSPVSLSPIAFVIPTYLDKAAKFIETGGRSYFGEGDLTFSVLDAYRRWGAVPESVYDGIIDGEWQHDHLEMNNLLAAMVKSVGASGYGRIKPNSWRQSVRAVLAAYIGEPPDQFEFRGRTYTPRDFADTFIGITADDYIEITSFSHLPFDRMVVLGIPANWRQQPYLNLKLADFQRVVRHALNQGFSLAWDGDASEPGFQHDRGTAILTPPEVPAVVTQEHRQAAFRNGSTTDDHNMHLIGLAENSAGKPYFILKNSEGPNPFGGYLYMSSPYFWMKTISLLVHRDGLPADIRKRIRARNAPWPKGQPSHPRRPERPGLANHHRPTDPEQKTVVHPRPQ